MARKNLLITTIGNLECLPSWICDDRNFDIALIYYPEKIESETKQYLEEISDYLFFEQGFKYSLIQKIFYQNPHLLGYDYFWMPDHDVMLRKGPINEMFDFMRDHSLELGQPSLIDRNRSWKILVNRPQYSHRYINSVEIMCPIFSKKALETCLESFSFSYSGWGIAMLWGKLIDAPKAVIDKFLVEHMTKMDEENGPLYRKLLETTGKRPEEERDYLIEKYNLDSKIRHISKVPVRGSFMYYWYKLIKNKFRSLS